jgi:NitT/TauT family transport system permease protein
VDASPWETVWKVRLPYSFPYLFSATRTCVGLALIGAVLAEWYALVDRGLGRRIQEAIDFNQSRQLWAAIYTVALLGGAAILVLNVIERRLLHWHPGARTIS